MITNPKWNTQNYDTYQFNIFKLQYLILITKGGAIRIYWSALEWEKPDNYIISLFKKQS